MLKNIRHTFGRLFQINERVSNGILYVNLASPISENDLEIFYDCNDIVLSIGKWTHCHPTSMEELNHSIEKIVKGKIIIWKVTRQDGYWYSGHYDIDEWKKNPNMVDEPDTNVENGDRIERSTFTKIIEDRIIK